MSRPSSHGKCLLCNATFGKAAMRRHLDACRRKQAASEAPAQKQTFVKARYFHLVVEGRGMRMYWLHLEVRASAELRDLDQFLRRIWLQCCGHLSAFTIGGTRYSMSPMRELEEKGMNVALGNVLRPKMKFLHEYDYGTTTELTLKVISERDGELTGKTVELLARNDPPETLCDGCGKPATQVCSECVWRGDGWLCEACAAEHECGEDYLLPVVNSPRTGMCAYIG